MTVIVKLPNADKSATLNFSPDLGPNESILSASIEMISPSGLVAQTDGVATPLVTVKLSGGSNGISYGVVVTCATDLPRTISRTIAVVVDYQIANTYQTRNPDAFNTLVDEIQAGEAAIGNGVFNFPTSVDVFQGFVTWELVDQDGLVYANGNAYNYTVYQTQTSNRVEAQAVINCPSSVLPTLDGQVYQIRWALSLAGQSPTYSFESLRVVAPNTVPLGSEDAIELATGDALLSLVLPRAYEYVTVEIYRGNVQVVGPQTIMKKVKVSSGWQYQGLLDVLAAGLTAQLDAYNLVWTYWQSNTSNVKERQYGRLFLVNPSILSAVEDMKIRVQKARATIMHQQDLLFTDAILLAYLRRGRDWFNGGWGMLTNFDMSDATSSVREYWLTYAEIYALRSQFLAEGEKVFNMSGQSISLDVDRTQYYEGLASALQSAVDAECKTYKQNLIKKGITGGTGNVDSLGLRPGAAGAIGITISPASNWGRLTGRFGGLIR